MRIVTVSASLSTSNGNDKNKKNQGAEVPIMSVLHEDEDEEWENNGEDGGGARLVRLLPWRNVKQGEEVADEEELELGVFVDSLVNSFFVSMVTTLSSILWWCRILVEFKVTGRTQLQRKPEKEKRTTIDPKFVYLIVTRYKSKVLCSFSLIHQTEQNCQLNYDNLLEQFLSKKDNEYDLATTEFQIHKQEKRWTPKLIWVCSYSSENYVNLLNELEISTNAHTEKEDDMLNKPQMDEIKR